MGASIEIAHKATAHAKAAILAKTRQQLNSPNIVVILRWAWHKTKRRPETLDLKRLHLDATKLYLAKLGEPLLVNTAGALHVQLGSRA